MPLLLLKPGCECCDTDLPPGADNALICSFECTFCSDCADNLLNGTCPNCGGGFQKRPVRPSTLLERYPASAERVYNPQLATRG